MALFFVLFFVLFLSLAAVIDGNNETLLEKLSGFVADVNTAYAVTESFNDTIGSHFVTEMIIQNQVEEKQMKAGAKEIAETIVQLPNIQTLPEYIATSMDKLKHFAEQFLGTEQMKMPGYDHMNKIYSAIKELMHELVNTEQLLITDISSLTTQQCLMFMGEDYNRFNEAIDLLLANLEDVENPVGDESLREIGDEIDKMLSDSDQAKSLRIQHQLFYMEKMKSTMETVTCESENGRRGSPREAASQRSDICNGKSSFDKGMCALMNSNILSSAEGNQLGRITGEIENGASKVVVPDDKLRVLVTLLLGDSNIEVKPKELSQRSDICNGKSSFDKGMCALMNSNILSSAEGNQLGRIAGEIENGATKVVVPDDKLRVLVTLLLGDSNIEVKPKELSQRSDICNGKSSFDKGMCALMNSNILSSAEGNQLGRIAGEIENGATKVVVPDDKLRVLVTLLLGNSNIEVKPKELSQRSDICNGKSSFDKGMCALMNSNILSSAEGNQLGRIAGEIENGATKVVVPDDKLRVLVTLLLGDSNIEVKPKELSQHARSDDSSQMKKRRFIRAVESRRCGSLHSYLERNGHVAGDMVLKMQRAINVMQRTIMVSYDQLLVSIGKLTDKVRDWKSNLNLKMQFDSLIEDCQSAMAGP